MKKISLTESQLTNIIQKVVTKKLSKLNEDSADINQDGVISPEELYEHFDLDGDGVVTMADYAAHVDFHCENPELLQKERETEDYISKMEQDREPFVAFFGVDGMAPMMEQEEDDYEEEDMDEEPNKYPVEDAMFDLDDSDVADIMSTDGPTRRFRGSIYIDELIPETDDVEYDRKLAIKVLENYAKKLPTREYYIGGAGFKQRSLIEPYDNMDF
jgi:hypothetical protein